MKKIIFLTISSFVLWSCNTSETSKSNQEVTTEEEAHHHHESSEALELDHGEKWLVNNEMKPFVEEGEKLVNTYIHYNQTDYKTLATQIKEQNNQLISSCTMDGKSHDELHKWLHPHLDLVGALEEASDESEAKDIIMELQESYMMYHQYFK